MFSQTNAQKDVTTSLFTVTQASIGSQRIQAINPAKSAKFGAVPMKPAVPMNSLGKGSSNAVSFASSQRISVKMSASNQDSEQISQNKFVQGMQQAAQSISNEIDMALNPQQQYMQLATPYGQFPTESNLTQNIMNFNQVKSMRPGGNMNQSGIAHSQFTVSNKPAARSSVRMDASIALSGDGPVEGLPDYMDKINEMQEEAEQRITQTMEKMKESVSRTSDIKMEAATMEYATDLDSFLPNKPHDHAVIANEDENGNVPNNTFKPKDPYVGKVIFNETLTGPDAGEVCHIAFDHQGNLPYAEGQSIGIIAKGEDKNGKPHKLRLYSIASSAPGDYGDGKTVSLCVKRLIYEDEDGNEVKGVCSNYICDLKPGDEVMITGPVGKALLLPKDEKANVIMLATGTGIAPFRSFLWRFFMENHPDYKFDGLAWLFLGVPTTSALLYDNEFKKMKEIGGDKFRYDYAISREQKNEAGDKMYIQTRMAEYAQELWDKMQLPNTYVYMCGLKGMESGIQEALGGIAEKNGTDWKDFVKKMKKEGRYHVEVY